MTIDCPSDLPAQWPTLIDRWSCAYPAIFDQDSVRIAGGPKMVAHPLVGFHSWFAAIYLFRACGVRVIHTGYTWHTHPRKGALLDRVFCDAGVDPKWIRLLQRRSQRNPSGLEGEPPDLFVFSPNRRAFGFVEVKGPHDTLRSRQRDEFERIGRFFGVPVLELRIRYVTTPFSAQRAAWYRVAVNHSRTYTPPSVANAVPWRSASSA
jgi:hypothetical protein